MPKVAPAKPAAFNGFDRGAPQFFHELAIEMNREWFDANKARYVTEWAEPMTALLADITAGVAKAYAPIKLGAPKLFRIHRDVRFAKDKTPYKTHIAGVIPVANKKPTDGGCAAMYVHFGLDGEFVGVGSWFFDEEQLPNWRKLVAADKTGKPLVALVTKLRKQGYEVGGHDDYKKVPKGFDPDHPRAELLKMRGLSAGFPAMPKGLLHQAKLADWLVAHGKKTAPLVTWLVRHVG